MKSYTETIFNILLNKVILIMFDDQNDDTNEQPFELCIIRQSSNGCSLVSSFEVWKILSDSLIIELETKSFPYDSYLHYGSVFWHDLIWTFNVNKLLAFLINRFSQTKTVQKIRGTFILRLTVLFSLMIRSPKTVFTSAFAA